MFVTSSSGILGLGLLPTALGGRVVRWHRFWSPRPDRITAAVGWGKKGNASALRIWSARHGVPFLNLEDGFIRSIGLGVAGCPAFGFVVDPLGMYYDATGPSELERLILAANDPDPEGIHELMRRFVAIRASKYNHCFNEPSLRPGPGGAVLVVDQTFGDLSISLGSASAHSFAEMLQAALDEHPGAEIWCKVHPDVLAGKKRGHLPAVLPDRCRIIREDCNPQELLRQVDAVYCVTSQMGFEGLLAGKPVRCFGLPFFAGWGLTQDALACPRRGTPRTLAAVFKAAYIDYVRYVDPIIGTRCSLTEILTRIDDHRRSAQRCGGRVWCLGFTARKHGFIRAFELAGDCRFVASSTEALTAGACSGDRVATWSFRADSEAKHLADTLATPIERVEDGFIRSVGLGSDFVPPRSLVFDRSGIYFDPTQPSDLELLLANASFTEADRCRGAALIALLRQARITKYNTGLDTAAGLALSPGRRRILVPGQVEDDASIQKGCPGIATNLNLLKAARAAEPEAFILYKPHPDVLAGNRRGHVDNASARSLADVIVQDLSMDACLDQVEAVHTLTSLTGFEALIRGREVHVHGLPFYAGWGLTHDRHALPRRQRTLDLTELVFATLVLYPRYLDHKLGIFTGPEDAIRDLVYQRSGGPVPIRCHWSLRWGRKLKNIFRSAVC